MYLISDSALLNIDQKSNLLMRTHAAMEHLGFEASDNTTPP